MSTAKGILTLAHLSTKEPRFFRESPLGDFPKTKKWKPGGLPLGCFAAGTDGCIVT